MFSHPLFMFNLDVTTKIVPFGSQTLSLTLKSVKTSNPSLFRFTQGSEWWTTSEQMEQSEGEQTFSPEVYSNSVAALHSQQDICQCLGWKGLRQTKSTILARALKWSVCDLGIQFYIDDYRCQRYFKISNISNKWSHQIQKIPVHLRS